MLTGYLWGFPSLLAGMPSITLTDVVRMRLQTISFFAVGVLLSAAAVCWLWNRLRQDFDVLPHLRYRAALFGTVLWGLLFLLVSDDDLRCPRTPHTGSLGEDRLDLQTCRAGRC